ncbi:uncharacterized protein A4U43_C02F16060 [Asparagus officinalis]|uniref:BHLH domain-containing protein n=1 Tax=Asparagus officinalis TaxID=4686 RepID=A0A5P1FIU5_ASPOF|nr:transcription factor bHLH137-like [Asparagus officinalis]XP_020254450.1 transcription factor bHLH137-like [Asparagus officinalis]ONK78236.1 uncharacterized protein A4U43_C02F16060 [Asparagus officinalis]
MEAFLYHHQCPLFLDPIEISLLPHQQNGEQSNASSSCLITGYNSSEAMQEASTCSLDALPPLKPQVSLEKKRKQSDGGPSSTSQTKVVKQSKSRRKKTICTSKGEVEEKKPKATELKSNKATIEEPPSGYIHVRARRGQATDSHSLAERVRRERISERMKKLQGLVPGCDKVTGKALVLDEIINYVQSLQNQVEFLSMRLASVNPVLYDFGVGYEEYMSQPEEMGSISQPMSSVIQNSHIQPTAFEAATNNLHQEVTDPAAPFSQVTGSFLMQAMNSMCSFH